MSDAEETGRAEFAHRKKVVNGTTIKELITELKLIDHDHKIQIRSIGRENDKPTVSVLLIGETGAGKTTFKNALINALMGVQVEDNFRYEAKDEISDDRPLYESQTEYILGTLINHKPGMPFQNNFLIIDTPGLLDSKMEEQRRRIRNQMEIFLKEERFGLLKLNCLAFVIKSTTNRRASYVREFIEEFGTLFSKDTESITSIVATFTGILDMEEDPLELKGILEELNVIYKNLYKFENSIVFSRHRRMTSSHMADLWATTMASYHKFIEDITGEKVEIHLTREQAIQKSSLEKDVARVKTIIKDKIRSIQKLEANKQQAILTTTILEENRNYEDEIEDIRRTRVSLASGYHAHNCKTCQETCYNNCYYVFNIFPRCPPTSGNCRKCSCSLSEHTLEREKINKEVRRRTVVNQEKKTAFEEAQTRLERITAENKDLQSRIEKSIPDLREANACILLRRDGLQRNLRTKSRQTNEMFFKNITKEIIDEMIMDVRDKTLFTQTLQEVEFKYEIP